MPHRQTAKIYQLADRSEPSLAAPFISVVISTRNRPELFAAALDSVVEQRYGAHEIVVVQDGSEAQHLPVYEDLLARLRQRLGHRLVMVNLPATARGHGSGRVMNVGVEAASGEYVTFLDDDDLWIDPTHLQRAVDVIRADIASGRTPDLYMANQEAMRAQQIIAPLWMAPLHGLLVREGRCASAMGVYRVSVEDVLKVRGFCHTNCLIVRRGLYLQVGGREESVRWEGDHNLYLRLLDQSQFILHHPSVVARHHVPLPALQASITTSMGKGERRRWQARSMALAVASMHTPALRTRAAWVQAQAFKHAAVAHATEGSWHAARSDALQALKLQPGLKWLAYTLWCWAVSLVKPSPRD